MYKIHEITKDIADITLKDLDPNTYKKHREYILLYLDDIDKIIMLLKHDKLNFDYNLKKLSYCIKHLSKLYKE